MAGEGDGKFGLHTTRPTGAPEKLFRKEGTLFGMIESGHVPKTSHPGIPDGQPYVVGQTLNEVEKQALEKAVPASVFEKKLISHVDAATRNSKRTIKRGMIMKHQPTDNKVTVIEADVDTTSKGEIRH